MIEVAEVQKEFKEAEEDNDVVVASYLIAEVGSANTVATLYELFNGSFQLVARGSSLTTAGSPWQDSVHGLHAAIQQVSDLSRRTLINNSNVLIRPVRPDGSGFDYFGTIISAAPPMRTVVIGLMDEVSIASARRALNTIYAQEVDCFSLADTRSKHEQLEALVNLKPDLIFISGGTSGGASRQLMSLVETAAMGIKLIDADHRPLVIFAGNPELRSEVERSIGDETDIYLIDNVRPDLENEHIDQAIGILGDLYVTSQSGKLPSGEFLIQRNDLPVLPVVHAFGALCEFVAALNKGRVLGVDIGRKSLSLIFAENDYVNLDVSSDLGLGEPNSKLSEDAQIMDIAAWAGIPQNKGAVEDHIANKTVWPAVVPLTLEEMHIEQAIVWANLSYAVERAHKRWNWSNEMALSPIRTLVLRGAALVNATNWKRLMLLLLDSIQPVGIFNVIVDRPGILPSLGLLAAYNPHLVVQLYQSISKDKLGWVIAPISSAQGGQLVLKISILREDQEPQNIEILQGDFKVLPIRAKQRVKITIAPTPDTDVGAGPGKRRSITLSGGPIGIVIDARGRPLTKNADPKSRQRHIRKWLKQVES
ncbi:MAG: glutamate mutase L [Anaerolineae bacterium]|nr:MAG: glutamate mutase L [Anaerolineae bacterium]